MHAATLKKIKRWLNFTKMLHLQYICYSKLNLPTQLFPVLRSLSSHCRRELREKVIEKHDKRLKELTVQNKIMKVTELEDSNQVWKRILLGLPAGTLSFILRVGTDTLPTPLILTRKRLKTDPSCPLVATNNPPFTTSSTTVLRCYSKEGTLGGMIVAS